MTREALIHRLNQSALAAPLAWTAHRLLPHAQHAPSRVARVAMRTRDPAPAEALARIATGGRLGHVELRAKVLSDARDVLRLPRRGRRAMLALSSVWAVTPGSPDAVLAAALTFEHLLTASAAPSLRAEQHVQAGQTMLLAGRHDALRELLPQLQLPAAVRLALETDLVNPWLPVSAASADSRLWADLFTRTFVEEGQVAPRVGTGGGSHPFDRLHAPGALAGGAGGQLVTVVMPCYRPDEGLLSSVRSIIAQTYGDLEILLVDDASGQGFEEVFHEAEALDPRIRRLTMERNGGSYIARERAIAESRGSLITFQDADDWSHPARIEHQVRILAEHGALVSRSMALRAHDDLSLQWVGYSPTRRNASSLLLHRQVLDRCGGFMPIRKGADSELAERVEHLGLRVADTETLLAITRLRHGSLSRADFTYSWMAPDRVAFRSAFRAWHRQLAEQGADASDLGAEALHALPFPVPLTFLRDLPGARVKPDRYSFVYLGDLSDDEGAASTWLRSHLTPDGDGPVGLWHQESPIGPRISRPTLSDTWSDLAQRLPRLRPVSRVEPVDVDRLVVLDPDVLALTTEQECQVRAGRVELCLHPDLVRPDASHLPADLLGLADRARDWLGTPPIWIPAPWLSRAEVAQVDAAVPGLLSGAAAAEVSHG